MGRTRSDIVIADDHPLVRGALRQAVEGAFKDVTVTETSDFDQLILVLAAQPETDLVLLDLAMPGMHGFSGLIYLRAQYANIPVVVVSANDNRCVMRRCIEIGAAGFIPKTMDLDAMRSRDRDRFGRRPVAAARPRPGDLLRSRIGRHHQTARLAHAAADAGVDDAVGRASE